jgi:O-antigen biosynthesis protein
MKMHPLVRSLLNAWRFLQLFTWSRVSRLWYYIRIGQYRVVLDRARNHLQDILGAQNVVPLTFPSDVQGPVTFQACETPTVSIIVPVYNEWETTRKCLLAIREHTDAIQYEVILADDCSQDETRNVAILAPGVRHVTNERNLGFLLNCNGAACVARGKYLVFLNNDTIVQPGWLEHLLRLIVQDSRNGLVGPMLLYGNGRVQEAGGIIWSDASGWNYGRHDFPWKPQYNYVKETDYLSGACILLRRALWDEIGGFDEQFVPAYYEDTDLAFEIRRRGYRVLYQPQSRVVHVEGVSHGTDIVSGIKAHQATNQIVFRNKWHDILEREQGRDVRDIVRARDRSLKKKRVLFVDHYVPKWDQDAGSRSTFQYLSLMAEMGYQITFLGDNFVGYQPYTSELQQMGIEVLYGSDLQRRRFAWVAENSRDFDYAYLSRPGIARKYLPILKKRSAAKLLYCGHDLHCLRAERQYAVEKQRAQLAEARRWAKWEGEILRQVDKAYFFSPFEVEEVARRFPGVKARAVPLLLFDEGNLPESSASSFGERAGLLFVGGFMHQPNVDAVHWLVEEILPLVRMHLPQVMLTIVGPNPPPEFANRNHQGVAVLGRVSEERLEELYQSHRLVVAPLRYGAGIKGKIIEAMKYGVPTITTSVGAEGIANSSQTLFVADDAQTFSEKLINVYQNRQLWEAASFESRATVKSHYSKAAARSILIEDMPP